MRTSADPGLARKLSFFGSAASLFSVAAGVIDLAGWKLHIPLLLTWGVLPVRMVPNAAACLVLLGISLWFHRRGDRKSFSWGWKLSARTPAALASLIGLLSLAEHISGRDFGIDQLLVVVPLGDQIPGLRPGLIASVAAFDFVLLGIALMLLDWKTSGGEWPAQYLCLISAIGSIFGLFALLLQPRATGLTMAFPAAVTCFVLACGAIALRAPWAIGGLLISQSAGATFLRKVAPAALLVLGLLSRAISKPLLTEAHYTWVEASLLAILCAVLVAGFVTWIAFIVDRSEALNAKLERRVEERTTALQSEIAERQRVAEELHRTEQRYEVLFNEMMVGFALLEVIFDKSGSPYDFLYLEVNPAFETHCGLAREAVVGKTIREVLPDLEPIWMETYAKVAATGESAHFENYAQPVRRWLELTAFRTHDRRLAVTFTDVTERHQTQADRALLAAVVDSTDDAIITKTLDGTITAWNRAAEKVFGYSSSEAVGKTMLMLIPPDRVSEESTILARIARGENVEHFETIRLRKDGKAIEVSVTISAIRDSNGGIIGASKIARDIRERKRADRALRLLSDGNDSLMRATDELSLLQRICDLVVNVGGYRMAWVGYAVPDETKSVEVAAKSGFEAGYLDTLNLTWADQERGRGPTGTAIRTGRAQVCCDTGADPCFAHWRTQALQRGYRSSMVLPLKCREDVLGAISIYATEVGAFDASEQALLEELSNNLSFGIAALRARRERLQAEEDLANQAQELARSNADLQQFAYIASHDLQEPLRMVTAYTQLLGERYRGKLDANADKFIGYASEGAQRMQVLIQDLLAYSRVGRKEAACGSVDCNVLMREVLQTLSSAIEESGAVVTYRNLPSVWTDRTQMAQVFQNLVGNAIKFRGEEKPVISVQAETADPHWLFSVSDNGIGIASENAEEIFVVFQRLHARSEYSGNGIGLAICKKIIERCGGRIWVESQPGCGSTFKFTMPLHGSHEYGSDEPEGVRHEIRSPVAVGG